MKKTFVQTDFTVDAFSASRIIFDDSDLVSLNVICRIHDELLQTSLLFTFSAFNDLLRYSGQSGEQVQLLVSNKLLGKEEAPHIIDLGQKPIVFSACSLQLSYLIADDDSCFSAEEVRPLSYVQQIKNLRKNIKDFEQVVLHENHNQKQALMELASLYLYYKGLLELNVSDDFAKEKAGLSNPTIFKMAYMAAKKRE
ncbi:MAG: hypothetical protein R2831_07025 [Chitinophagaceae bacterium]